MVALGQTGVEIVIKARDQFSKVFNRAQLSMAKFRSTATVVAASGLAIAAGFAKAIQTSIDFESAFTGVRKTVELTEEGFAELEKRFKTLSTETGTTFVELSRIGELAGQLGITGVDNLEKFTKTIADISVTTNLTAEQAATDFARFANIMDMSIQDVDRLGATIVDLGNNAATTEAEIVAMSLRIAGAGKALDFTENQVLAWSTALSSVGIRAELGGSAISKLMINISSMVSSGSKDLEGFADVAGMTSDEFSKAFKEDASKALKLFFKGLNSVKEEGGDVLAVLEKLDIKEIRLRDTVLRLASGYDKLDSSLNIGATAWEENTALIDEAEKRYATMERQIAKVKARFAILGDEIGDRVAPLIRDFLVPAIDKLINFWENLSPVVQNAILLLGGVTVVVSALAGAIAIITLVSLPWLAIIGAIILAITGIILLIKNWDIIIKKLQNGRLAPFIDFLKNIFSPTIEGIKLAIVLLGIAFKFLWDKNIKPVFEKIKIFVNFLKENVLPIVLKIADKIGKVSGAIGSFVGGVRTSIQSKQVGDAIIRPNGQIIETDPRDTLIATKGGMGVVVNIGTIMGLDAEDISKSLSDELGNKVSL